MAALPPPLVGTASSRVCVDERGQLLASCRRGRILKKTVLPSGVWGGFTG